MKRWTVSIIYGQLCSQTYTVSAADRVGASHAAFAAQRAAGWSPWVAFWQRPFVSIDEVVERPRATEPLRVLKRGVAA